MLTTVAVLALDDLAVFEFGILCEMFGLDRTGDGIPRLEFRVCGLRAGEAIATTAGVRIVPEFGLDGLRGADLIAIPATGHREGFPDAALDAVRTAATAPGTTLLTICSGAFVAGAAGLLDGRRCTTHWQAVDELRRRHPSAVIDPDVLFVDDGDLVSSAGAAAGIDACLHVVRRELGTTTARTLARLIVVPPQRQGGQRQFVDVPIPECTNDAIAPTLDWALENLGADHTVAALAERAHMSERSFARRFLAVTGTSPHRWLTQQRVLQARLLLEETAMAIEDVADACGFGSGAKMRHHFTRIVGVTPVDYRRTFRSQLVGG